MAGRLNWRTTARIAAAVSAVALASAVGGVAVASQASQAGPHQLTHPVVAALSGPRACGAPTSFAFSGISVSVKACLQTGPGQPVAMEYSADVSVTSSTPDAVAYCTVELEGTMHVVGSPRPTRALSCFDFVNKPTTTYVGGVDNRATSDGWSLATVLIGTNKGTVRIVKAQFETPSVR